MTAAFYTLGCKVNQYESNEMAALLRKNGFDVVSSDEDADVYIINSCTVTAESSRKSRQNARRLKKLHTDAIIVLTGCYAQAFTEEAAEKSGADIVLGNNANSSIFDEIRRFQKSGKQVIAVRKHKKDDKFSGTGVSDFEGHTRANIKIQDGCNRYCTYCIIPKARGFSRSKPLENIKEELEAIAKAGYKEVVFTGINLTAYGLDNGHSFAEAIGAAQNTRGIERIRLGSLEPDHITDDVIKALSEMDKFCPQFHLSLQSGSDNILKRMNRHYTTAQYSELCKKLKDSFDNLSLTTDIITGFPGETEEDFQKSMDFAKQTGFMKVHVFPFSAREGTPAYSYPDKIPSCEKEKRSRILQRECDAVRERYLDSFIGKTLDVLFETPKNGLQQGYTKNYIPVYTESDESLAGMILDVKLTELFADGVKGVLIRE